MGGVPNDKFVSEVELPSHGVEIRAFQLSSHPVTRGQWCPGADDPDLPMIGVSFSEAEDFAYGLGCRLPSEAEWEYACRAGSSGIFPHGAELVPEDANFLYDESGERVGCGRLSPVGLRKPNAFGLHDMIGNVCEWTADLWHPSYRNAPVDGSPWIMAGNAGKRVIRGGAWDQLPRVLRASWRDWAPESASWDNLGFRLAREI